MKINAVLSAERDRFVFEKFSLQPSPKVNDVQAELKASYGWAMSLKRIHELRRAAHAGMPLPVREVKPRAPRTPKVAP